MSSLGKSIKWTLGVIAVLFIGLLIFIQVFWEGKTEQWVADSRKDNGTLLFKPHIENHPGHYSFTQRLSIATKIDMVDLMSGDRYERFRKGYEEFPQITPVGSPAPDFELQTTDGETIRMSDSRGKIAVFMFVAMTCPPARFQVPLWTELSKKYESEDVEFFVIYSREQHPGEPGFRDFIQPTTYKKKLEYATMLAQLTDLTVAVDSVEMSTLNKYGIVPNAAFVVDRDGAIVFKSTWADHVKVEQIVETLLDFYQKQNPAA